MTADLSVEIDGPDRSTLTRAAGAAGRTLEAYVAELVHTEAVRLRQAEASGGPVGRRSTAKDTWFPSLTRGGGDDDEERPELGPPVEDELDD
ncbi:hypothetical protein [Raineyella sp.]|uniref:Uncharacterized protein n=1 Tax=bioreactor metagenome TaxID=1076179 RepID=A0A645BCW1_9ZZZZ|nr:hypothetical protein [Raineyella sp.]MEA5155363.1 hypothetical protein [Raineyella sp.]